MSQAGGPQPPEEARAGLQECTLGRRAGLLGLGEVPVIWVPGSKGRRAE